MYLRKKDKLFIGALSLSFLFISLSGWLIWGEIALIVSLVLVMGVLMTVQIESYRRIDRRIHEGSQEQFRVFRQDYRQIESLFSMFASLKTNHPLPAMRDWAISPDFANIMISLIHEQNPGLILEAGSGVSTLVAAYCLKERGEGKIISLDHEKRFAEISARNIIKHQLQETAAVIYAPLKEVAIRDETWLWYDTVGLEQIESIDMLIIDGPPGHIQKLARYPALPILFNLLSENAVILLDDGFREDEKKVVDLWLKEFNCFKYESIDSEKGTIILRKTNT